MIPFEIIPTADVEKSGPRLRYILSRMLEQGDWLLETVDSEKLAFYTLFRDLYGLPAFIITAQMPRDIVKRGQASLLYAWISTFAAWTIITLILLLLIRKNVLKPINRLTNHILKLEETGDLSLSIENSTNDEIGILVTEFNRLIDQVDENKVELEQMNAELTRLNRQKDLLFSVLSHDLRTPFTTLSAASYLIEEAAAAGDLGEIQSISSLMNRNIQQGEELLRNLLEWIKVQMSGNLSPDSRPVCSSILIESAVAYLRDRAAQKKITISTGSSCSLLLEVEQTSVTACLRNVISNSIKFSNENGRITICCGQTGDKCYIEVADDGTGISDDIMAKIHDEAGRFSSTGTDGEIGSGMGLLMTRELLRMNKGELEIKSRPGQGTTVTFLFPATEKTNTAE